MNDQEKKQWLADMYQQAADGGELQLRTGAGTWIDDHRGPALGNDLESWRIKPALKVIDMSVMVGAGLDCEFWQKNMEGKFYGPLHSFRPHHSYPSALEYRGRFKQCQPRMTPYIHFWSGGDTCPVPEGFEVRLHTRTLGFARLNFSANWNHNECGGDIIGIEFLGEKEGYTLGGE